LDSATQKTWVSTLEFHENLKRFQSYKPDHRFAVVWLDVGNFR
jgi:hypothetical protein